MPDTDADTDADPHLAPRLLIRAERQGDADAIRRVHDAAFGGLIEGRIVDELRDTEWWLPWGSLVAIGASERIVGHLLMSRATLDGAADDRWPILVIGPVGARPEEQGRGIGAALMRAAIAEASDRGESLVCLVGHADYYPRFGFEPARGIGVQPPHAWPDENWLALRLPAWTSALQGTARFPPAFPDG